MDTLKAKCLPLLLWTALFPLDNCMPCGNLRWTEPPGAPCGERFFPIGAEISTDTYSLLWSIVSSCTQTPSTAQGSFPGGSERYTNLWVERREFGGQIVCIIRKIVVGLPPGAGELPNHGLLTKFTVTGMVSPVAWNPFRKQLIEIHATIVSMDLLCYPGIDAHRVRHLMTIPPQQPTEDLQNSEANQLGVLWSLLK